MSSYLFFILTSELIFQNYIADLLNLVGFGFTLFGLEIQNFFDTLFGENMMTPMYSFVEIEGAEQS